MEIEDFKENEQVLALFEKLKVIADDEIDYKSTQDEKLYVWMRENNFEYTIKRYVCNNTDSYLLDLSEVFVWWKPVYLDLTKVKEEGKKPKLMLYLSTPEIEDKITQSNIQDFKQDAYAEHYDIIGWLNYRLATLFKANGTFYNGKSIIEK